MQVAIRPTWSEIQCLVCGVAAVICTQICRSRSSAAAGFKQTEMMQIVVFLSQLFSILWLESTLAAGTEHICTQPYLAEFEPGHFSTIRLLVVFTLVLPS